MARPSEASFPGQGRRGAGSGGSGHPSTPDWSRFPAWQEDPPHTLPRELSPLGSPLPDLRVSAQPHCCLTPSCLLSSPAFSQGTRLKASTPISTSKGLFLAGPALSPAASPHGPKGAGFHGGSHIGRISVGSWFRAGVGRSFPDRPHRPTVGRLDPTAGARRRHTPAGTRDSQTAAQTLAGSPPPNTPPPLPPNSSRLPRPHPRAPPFAWLLPRRPRAPPLAARVPFLHASSPSSTLPPHSSLPSPFFPSPRPFAPTFHHLLRPSSLQTFTCPPNPAVRPSTTPLQVTLAPYLPHRVPPCSPPTSSLPSPSRAPLPRSRSLSLRVFSSPLPAKFRGCQSVSLSGGPHPNCRQRAPSRAEPAGAPGSRQQRGDPAGRQPGPGGGGA